MTQRNIELDMDDAISGLSRSLEAIQQRITAHGSAIAQLQSERRRRLSIEAEKLIPDISKGTWQGLATRSPAFVAAGHVREVFARQGKLLGVFKRKGYDQSLALLRTHLAAHLDGRIAETQTIDAEIAALTEERRSLSLQVQDLMSTLKTLATVKAGTVGLDAVGSDSVADIARKSRQMRQAHKFGIGRPTSVIRQVRTQPQSGLVSSAAPISASDDTDLWIYAFTDVPLSFRTLALDVLHEHPAPHREQFTAGGATDTFAGGGATGSWGESSSTTPTSADNAVATDDRLGLFS